MGRDLKLGVFYNSKLKLSDEVNANILSIIACGISGENLAFDNLNLAYTELQGTLYYAIKDLPNIFLDNKRGSEAENFIFFYQLEKIKADNSKQLKLEK